jgi:hypothetical protein
MGAFKEIYDEYMYVGDVVVEDSDVVVDTFTELLPGFAEVLNFERPEGPLRYNPFEEIATPIKPLSSWIYKPIALNAVFG